MLSAVGDEVYGRSEWNQSGTFVVPANVTSISVICGAGTDFGEQDFANDVDVTAGQTFAVTVGTSMGSTTSFGALASVTVDDPDTTDITILWPGRLRQWPDSIGGALVDDEVYQNGVLQ